MADRHEIDEVRARTDIVSVIEPYVTLKRAGHKLKGLCPFHNEKTPSFNVDPELGLWRCFGQCGEGGDVFKFVQKIENLTFVEALERLALRAGVTLTRRGGDSSHNSRDAGSNALPERDDRALTYRINAVALRYFREMLVRSPMARAYFQDRGLAHAVQEDFLLGFAPDDWEGLVGYLSRAGVALDDAEKAGLVTRSERGGFFDKMRGRAIFPIFDVQERPVAFGGRVLGESRPGQPKYWNSPETPVFSKSRTLYGLHRARKAIAASGQAVIVEGYTDVLAAHQAGFENVVATLGTSLTEDHVKILARLAPMVVLAFDSDSAGLKAAFRAGEIFEAQEVEARVLDLPEGEDPDSLLSAGRRTVFEDAIARAVPLVEYRLRRLIRKGPTETEAERVALFRKALPILASVASSIEREQFVRMLAPFHPVSETGFAFAQEQIRQDVSQLRAGSTPPSARPNFSPPPRAAIRPPGGATAQAERHLLRALFSGDSVLSGHVLAEASPDLFVTPGVRALAARLFAEEASIHLLGAPSFLAEMGDVEQSTALASLLTDEEDALTIEELDGDIDHLRKQQEKSETAQLKARIDSGQAQPHEIQQYLDRQRRAKTGAR